MEFLIYFFIYMCLDSKNEFEDIGRKRLLIQLILILQLRKKGIVQQKEYKVRSKEIWFLDLDLGLISFVILCKLFFFFGFQYNKGFDLGDCYIFRFWLIIIILYNRVINNIFQIISSDFGNCRFRSVIIFFYNIYVLLKLLKCI